VAILDVVSQPRKLQHRYGHMAPAALREKGFRLYFYSGEEKEKPHIHVAYEGRVAKFWLNPVELVENKKMSKGELRQAYAIVKRHAAYLLEAWDAHFT
jgi:Domain of unknown function (DUF4160)